MSAVQGAQQSSGSEVNRKHRGYEDFAWYRFYDLFYVTTEESEGVVMKLKTRVFGLYKGKY